MTRPFDEDDLIARYFAPIAGAGGLGLKDDAALVAPPPGHEIVATVDAIVAGVHYFPNDPPESVARKALRVNLSDLAAKGADPLGFLLTLALTRDTTAEWLAAFAGALGADARACCVPLLGGDTVKTPGPAMISITALGVVPTGRMVARTSVKPGDFLYVSGTIGDAAIGLKLRLDEAAASSLSAASRAYLLARYLEPTPRGALTHAMRAHASGGMDVSDGLVGDVSKMLGASGVTGRVRLSDTPLSDAAREAIGLDPALLDVALTGGDDYELIASVPPSRAAAFERDAIASGVSVTRIGEAAAGREPAIFLGADGAPRIFARGSFSHF